MAFYDNNGQILIDEAAAQLDIQRAVEAEEILKEAVAALQNTVTEAQQFQGNMAEAVAEKARKMIEKIQTLLDASQEMRRYTNQVVCHYQELDRKLAQEMGG